MSGSEEITHGEEETIAAGERLGRVLEAGDVVALDGPLGAGKTQFAKGVVRGLGSGDPVTSPTFALVNEYTGGRLPVFHFDFYRVDEPGELLGIGWEEYLDEEGVVVVEWAGKFPELVPDTARRATLSIEPGGAHRIVLS